MTDRAMPFDVDAEQAVLGAMLESDKAVVIASHSLTADDFWDPKHRLIFDAILDLQVSGAVDPVRLMDALRRHKKLEDAGGSPYITELLGSSVGSVGRYTQIVTDYSRMRALVGVGHEITELGHSSPEDVDKALEAAEALVYSIARPTPTEKAPTTLQAEAAWVLERLEEEAKAEKPPGFSCGLPSIDGLLGGFQPGMYLVVGAGTSQGKTSWLAEIATKAAEQGRRIAYFSLEMPRRQIVSRMLAQRSEVPVHHLTNPKLMTDVDWVMLTEAASKLPEGVHVLDQPLELRALLPRLRRLEAAHGRIDVVMLDYIQLVENYIPKASREERVGGVSRTLKRLANEMGVTVIAASQLSRDHEKEKRRPTKRDLRESGSLEQDPDAVVFLHRRAWRKDEPHLDGIRPTEVIVDKNRHGPTGIVDAHFLEQMNRFVEP